MKPEISQWAELMTETGGPVEVAEPLQYRARETPGARHKKGACP
jgi:hypothetical protein